MWRNACRVVLTLMIILSSSSSSCLSMHPTMMGIQDWGVVSYCGADAVSRGVFCRHCMHRGRTWKDSRTMHMHSNISLRQNYEQQCMLDFCGWDLRLYVWNDDDVWLWLCGVVWWNEWLYVCIHIMLSNSTATVISVKTTSTTGAFAAFWRVDLTL